VICGWGGRSWWPRRTDTGVLPCGQVPSARFRPAAGEPAVMRHHLLATDCGTLSLVRTAKAPTAAIRMAINPQAMTISACGCELRPGKHSVITCPKHR
jgi:hypothetical protein